jgi:putative heme iron utilization protein
MTNPIRPTDDEARALARRLLRDARHAVLAVIDPATGAPMTSRIALATDPAGIPMSLVSSLAQHTGALAARADCSLLVGEPGARGDPLTHPRLTLQAEASFVQRDETAFGDLAAHYLRQHPKAKGWIGFGDFRLFRFQPGRAFLNGGFGRAFHLDRADLGF